MSGEKAYRLHEYRIVAYDDIVVRWEKHVPLGMVRVGRCFVWGDVLIISGKSHDEDGFLIGEFHDKLLELPPWTGTRYYCLASELLDPLTGQNPTDHVLARLSAGMEIDRTFRRSTATADAGSYRLGIYCVTVASDGRIVWRTYEDANKIISGTCSIESDILIVGPKDREEPGIDKHQFLEEVNRLRQWDRSELWCRGSGLRLCGEMQANENTEHAGGFRNIGLNRSVPEKPSARRVESAGPASRFGGAKTQSGWQPDTSGRIMLELMDRLKGFRKRLKKGKTLLKWSFVLMTVILLLALAATLYIVAKDSHSTHDSKKHHEKHHDH